MVCLFIFIRRYSSILFYLGAGAQEENLHRRTNMFQCLEDPYRELEGQRDSGYHIPEVKCNILKFILKETFFLQSFGGIYTPDVSVFRGSESNGYPFFQTVQNTFHLLLALLILIRQQKPIKLEN